MSSSFFGAWCGNRLIRSIRRQAGTDILVVSGATTAGMLGLVVGFDKDNPCNFLIINFFSSIAGGLLGNMANEVTSYVRR